MPAEQSRTVRHHVRSPARARGGEIHDRRADDGNVIPKPGNLLLKARPNGDVVGIETRNVTPLRKIETGVQRGGKPEALGVRDDLQAWIRIAVQNLRRRVGGAVVDDDQLEIPQGLFQDAVDRFADERGIVVD